MIRNLLLKSIVLKIKKSSWLNSFVRWILYGLVRILFMTYRLDVSYKENISMQNIQGVFYFWHQQIIAGMFFFFATRSTGACIVSPSNDGKIIGFVCKKLGFSVLYGSHQKQTIKLVKDSLETLKKTGKLCLVGDGSRGPAFKLQKGVSYLAEKAMLPLVYVECNPQWSITFKRSWDKFKIPLPFSKISVIVHVCPRSIT